VDADKRIRVVRGMSEKMPGGTRSRATPSSERDATLREAEDAEVASAGPRLPVAGQRVAQRYTVLSPLGTGGMAVVMAAYDARLDRRVALKLLHPETAQDGKTLGDRSTRMLREAHAMARVSHPNVVSVFDAGQLEDGQLFIAMEIVEGQTLRHWCRAPGRTWREVLRAYLEAGRGLAAAHAVGIIHRDFKPNNVLVGTDGRIKVSDFGVARLGNLSWTPTSSSSSSQEEDEALSSTGEDSGKRALTQTGALMGTPRYMAPELWAGRPADERTDLYSFCTALYEGLYRQRPFPNLKLKELVAMKAAGRWLPPPARTEVPAWVTRAVLHGLSPAPEDRPPSLEALLAALADDPAQRRQGRLRMVALAGAVAVLAGVTPWAVTRHPERRCGLPEERLSGLWDKPARQRLRDALLETRLAFAQATAERVDAGLSAYALDWARQRTEVCEAESGSTAQPASLLALRTECLEQRRGQLKALVEVLARGPDPDIPTRAVQAVQSLSPLSDCADARGLASAVSPPESSAVRLKLVPLRAQVDRVQALEAAGKYREGLALGQELLPEVQGLGYAPLEGRLLFLISRIKNLLGDADGALAAAWKGLMAASRGKDDRLGARILGQSVWILGVQRQKTQEALALVPAAEAAMERADDDQVRLDVENILGSFLYNAGRYEDARQRLERASALIEGSALPDNNKIIWPLLNLAIIYRAFGRYDEAKRTLDRALALVQRVLGPEHPTVTAALNNLALLLSHQGHHEEARARIEEALALKRKVQGAEHPDMAVLESSLGEVLLPQALYDEALAAIENGLRIASKTVGTTSPRYAGLLLDRVDLELRLGRYEEARRDTGQARLIYERTGHDLLRDAKVREGQLLYEEGQYAKARGVFEDVLPRFEKELGTVPPQVALVHVALGRALIRLGELGGAEHHLEQARATLETTLGPQSYRLAPPLLGQGELLLARHQVAQAVLVLERSLALASPEWKPEVQQVLAEALFQDGSLRSRALALAREARSQYRRVGNAPKRAEVERWLARHGGS